MLTTIIIALAVIAAIGSLGFLWVCWTAFRADDCQHSTDFDNGGDNE